MHETVVIVVFLSCAMMSLAHSLFEVQPKACVLILPDWEWPSRHPAKRRERRRWRLGEGAGARRQRAARAVGTTHAQP